MSVFSSVLGNKVGRSVFDLSHVKRFTCDMGQLIPVYFDECVPGDTRKIGMQCVTRFQPLVAPILDSVDLSVHYFFVPTRLLMDKEEDWNTFLTGGKDGKDSSVSLPLWQFAYFNGTSNPSINNPFSNGVANGKYSLWDYFGLPVGSSSAFSFSVRDCNHVLSFPQRAYNLVWNEFYRDENLCDEVSLNNSTILYRAWKKDYFTSALPWQQRGVAPALPLSGTLQVNFGSSFDLNNPKVSIKGSDYDIASGYSGSFNYLRATSPQGNDYADTVTSIKASVPSASVNLADGTTFDIATLRQCVQIQRWLELK